jgi:hypothetical protein
MTLTAILKELVVAGVRAGVDAVADLVRKKPKEPPHMTWKDIEHVRAQERSATAHKVKGPKP